MAKATVDDVIQEVEQLTPDERARVRAHIERLADTLDSKTSEDALHVRTGLADDLAALEVLAAKIGAAWKTERSAPDAVSDMRREL